MANNPLNIRFSDQNNWLGQSGSDRGFVSFVDDAYSYRAADQLISNYATNRGARSVRDVVSIYAPPNENNTDNYVRFVAGRMGVGLDDTLDLSDPNIRSNMLSAMALMESGIRISPGEVSQKISDADANNTTDLSAVFDSVFGGAPQPAAQPSTTTATTGFDISGGPQLPSDFKGVQAQPGDFEAIEQARPYSLGEAFNRGMSSGAVGMRSSFNYFDAAFNTITGDEKEAKDALYLARQFDKQAGAYTAGTPGFDTFLEAPTVYGFLEQALSFGGQVAPSVGATLATGLGGAIGGVIAKKGLGAASRAIAKDLAEDVAAKAARGEALDEAEDAMLQGAWGYIKSNPAKSGAVAGAFGQEYPMMAGESFGEFDEAGVDLDKDRAVQSILTGVPLAAIGVGGEAFIAKAFADKALKEAAKGGAKAGVFKQFAKDVLGTGVKSGVTEAGTELAQEEALIRQRQSVDANYSAREANLRRATALFAGFVAGGSVGSVGGGLASVVKQSRSVPQAISAEAAAVAQEAQEMLQQQASNDMSAAMDQAEMFDTSELGQAPTTPAQTEAPLDTPTQGSQADLFDGQPTAPSQPSTPEALADDASFLDEVMSRPVGERKSLAQMSDEEFADLERRVDQQELNRVVNDPPVSEQIPVAEPDEQPVTQAEIAAEQQQEAGADPRDFNRVRRQTPVKREYGAVKKGTTNPDIFVGAYYSRNQDTIFIDTEYLKSQFENKPWANPRVEGVDPIPQDFVDRHIRTPDEWVEFVETHELAHTEYPQLQGESRAAYENRINAIAMAEIRDPVGRLPETEFLTEERIGNVQTDARAPGDDSPPLTRTQIRDRAFTESLPAPRAPTRAEQPLNETVSAEEDKKTDDSLAAQADRFNPPEQPTLVNRRSEPDIEELPKRENPISGGEKEKDITSDTAVAKNFQDIRYADRRPPINEPLMLSTVVETYRTAIPNIAVTQPLVTTGPDGKPIVAKLSGRFGVATSYRGAHHNGGVIVTDFEVSQHQRKLAGREPIISSTATTDTYSLPRLIAHELGHAAHSLLGDTLNNNPAVAAELKAIENFLYPGLRQEVLNAQNAGLEADYTFFNYLLSAEELIAEFNVYRLNGTGAEVAPTISSLLESVSNDPNLVVKRKVFPSGWLIIDPRTVTADRYLTVEDLTSVLPTQAARAAREAAPRTPTPAAPEPVAEGTAELSSQEQEFVKRTEKNIQAASRTPDPEADPEPDNTPSKYEVQTERVKSYAIVDDPQKRKEVVKASEEQPLTLRVDGELRKITSPVNAASFYTLKLANHFGLTDAQRADGFLRIAPLMSDTALKRLNDLVFDPINGALFTYDVDFEVVGPIEGELSAEGDLLDLARANKDSIRIAITATPTDFGRESTNVFDSTMAALLGRTDPVTKEKKFSIGPKRQAATPFAISGGDLKKGTFRKFELSTLIKGGRRANTLESEALIGTTLEEKDPRTVKAGLIRGAREVISRGYQIGYVLNDQFVPLDLDAVFADNFRRATTVPVKITSAVVFDEGGVKYTTGDLLRIDDPRPVDETRSAQDQIRIERSSDEQLANAAAKHLFIANKGMTEDEYDFSFQDTQFRADWARERNRILNTTAEIELPDGRKEIIKPLLEQERKRQLDEVRDRELSQERFRKEEYAGDEGSLEAMSLSAAERAGVFDADKIADARREVVELRSQFGEIIFQQDIPLNSDPFVIAKALDGIKYWPYRSKSNRVSTIQDPAMAALARRIGLNINDPVLEKGQKPSKPLPSVRRRSLSMSQQERIGTRSRLVVEEGRRMGERQDQSVTMSRTPTPVDADRDPNFSRPRLPAKKAGRTKLIGRVFNQGRLSQGVQSIARFADQTLGLTTPVEVIALSALRDNLESYVGRGRRYSWAGKALRARVEKMTSEEGNVGGVEYMPGRGAIVVVNDTIDAKKFAENDVAMALTVGHEIGHVFFSEQIAAIEANPQLEKRMWDAFRKDRAQPDSPAQYKNDKHGFEEWFSDQVSKFLFDEAVKPQNLVESKFKAAAARLKRFFAKINKMFGGRFTKNTSFEGFMDELLTANSRNNIDSARPLGAATRIESRDLINSVNKEWVKKAERAGQKLMRSKTTGFYKKYISTAKRRLQYMGPAGAAIAAFFSSDSGVAGIRGMLEEAPAMEYAFTNKMVDILGIEIGEGENSWTSERVEKIMLEVEDESIPTEQLSTPEAKKLRALYKEAFEYNRAPDGSQYVQIRERANFGGGRSLSEAAIEQRIDEFIDFLVNDPDTGKARVDFEGKPFMSEKEAELTARYILAQPGESLEIAIQRIQESDYSAAIKAGKLDALYKAFDEAKITPGSANQFVRKLGIIPTKQLRAAGFLEPAGYAQVKYFHHLTRAVEYEKRGGSEFLRSQIENLPEEYKAEASSIIEGFLAKKGQTMKPWLRTFNSATQVHTVLTTLLLAPISSITDLSGIAIRGKSTQNMDLFFKNIMSSNKTSANFELAKRIGTIMQEGTDTVFVSQGDQDFSNKWARDIMHKFFKYTGLNLWTRYSRVVAVGMGRDFFIRNAEELSDPNITPARREELMRYMAEGHPDLTAQDVLDWANGSNFGTEAQLRVDAAIRRFADESVVRPNQGQRPSWANDPRFQVLFQLKSFFYAFGDTVVAGAIREGANRYAADGKFTGAAQMALLAGVTLIPLTMLGLEIRELIKYLLQAATPGIEATDYTFRSDYMDTPEYIYEIFSRTGVPGKWTLALTSIESLRWEGALGPIITNVPIFDAFDESVFDGRPFTRNAPVINNIQ